MIKKMAEKNMLVRTWVGMLLVFLLLCGFLCAEAEAQYQGGSADGFAAVDSEQERAGCNTDTPWYLTFFCDEDADGNTNNGLPSDGIPDSLPGVDIDDYIDVCIKDQQWNTLDRPPLIFYTLVFHPSIYIYTYIPKKRTPSFFISHLTLAFHFSSILLHSLVWQTIT